MGRKAVGFCVVACLMLVGLSHPAWSQAPAEKHGKLKNSIGMEFASIPAGKFLMGSPETEKERDRDETQHEMTLTQCFRMGVHEVTQAQYEQVMGKNPSELKGNTLPVETVSYKDALAFCKKLSDLPAEKAAGRKYRLPTEAEWENAARDLPVRGAFLARGRLAPAAPMQTAGLSMSFAACAEQLDLSQVTPEAGVAMSARARSSSTAEVACGACIAGVASASPTAAACARPIGKIKGSATRQSSRPTRRQILFIPTSKNRLKAGRAVPAAIRPDTHRTPAPAIAAGENSEAR